MNVLHKESYTILAVDDAEDSLLLLKFDLTQAGYDVLLADSSESAFEILQTTEVDLLLLDMYMPGQTGLSILMKVKSNPLFEHIPVIMLSASKDEDQIVAALELGASDYVTKPYNAKILLARMKNVLVLMEKTIQLEALANTDFLTKVNNRGSFENTVNKVISQANREKQPIALAMFDLDYFKKVNDSYGHESGDKALVEFAKILNKSFRDYDVVGRIGGEEFAVCMFNTSADEAFSACERCRISLMNKGIEVEFDDKIQAIYITVSAGLIAEHPPIASYDELLRRADHMLYQAKEQGRNQTFMEQHDMVEPDKNIDEQQQLVAGESQSKQQSAAKFTGIDYQTGVDNVLGDESLFNDILMMFYQDHAQDLDKIEQAMAQEDYQQTKHLVHTLKGVAASIGAMELFSATKALDIALREQQPEQYQMLFDGVASQLRVVLAEIQNALVDKL